ncbi:hypothetical protein NDU88_001661 [Pleurodeles waltl]|uniref:Uncharacterized protein n=1 Tax=Pleurodeles waltl TaxID=8319 RepID=A0AAV7RDN4_PLEWA|nr:hypothetical protein NDU88_001661 [Pleurodeles waltl]
MRAEEAPLPARVIRCHQGGPASVGPRAELGMSADSSERRAEDLFRVLVDLRPAAWDLRRSAGPWERTHRAALGALRLHPATGAGLGRDPHSIGAPSGAKKSP